jgi:hypothetical protein
MDDPANTTRPNRNGIYPSVRGTALPSALKPGDGDTLTDAQGVPFTQDNRQEHDSENAPVGIDATPKRESGAGVDINSADMPDNGILEVHDDDDDILDQDKS